MTKTDILKRTILKLDTFMIKRGNDMSLRRDIIEGINEYTGENSLKMIYVNAEQSTQVPYVFVMPKYYPDFNRFALNIDLNYHISWDYTLEISDLAFRTFSSEELMALILHAISQNVMSSMARSRFINAYGRALAEYRDDTVIKAFDDLSHSEVCYIAFSDICMRPIRVHVGNDDRLGTDEILKTAGLDDAFDSACRKIDGLNDNTPDQIIHRELENDYRTLYVVFQSVMNNDIRHYFEVIKNGIPLITLNNVLAEKKSGAVFGAVAVDNNLQYNRGDYRVHHDNQIVECAIDTNPQIADMSLLESLSNPKNEEELRYQLDKVGVSIDYISTEDEKVSILYRIKVLRLRIMKTKLEIERKLQRKKITPDEAAYKMSYLDKFSEVLEVYRRRAIDVKLKPRQIGLFTVYPEGYQY